MARPRPAEERYWAKIDRRGPDECWEWTGALLGRGRRYGVFEIKVDGLWRSTRAHRWGYEQFVGPIQPGLEVCHSCDNPPCNNPAHWFLGTTADNTADKVAKGRQSRGVTHGMSKLTEDAVREIRRDFVRISYHCTNAANLAERYDVDRTSILNIIKGKTWKHVA